MTTETITQLPLAIGLSGSEAIEIVQSGTSKQTTAQAIANLNATSGTVTQIDTNSPLTGGPITTTGTISLAAGGVTNTYLAPMADGTIKGNNSGSSASPSDLTGPQVLSLIGAAPLASPAFTGVPTAPTPLSSDNSTTIATTAYVKSQLLGGGTVTSVGTGAGLTGGPITSSGTISLTTTGVSAGTYGSSSQSATIAIDAYGRITSASNTPITTTAIGAVPITRLVNTSGALTGGGALSSDLTLTLSNIASGYVIGNASGSSASPTGVSVGTLLDYSFGNTQGQMLYRGASSWTVLNPGLSGQLLASGGSGGNPTWTTVAGAGTVTSVDGSGGSTGMTLTGGPITVSGTLTLGGTLNVAYGGTGATTLTGYVKGSGTSALTASATIPNTDITGLGTMSTQNANSVAITGGTATLTSIALTSGTISSAPVNGTDIANKTYVDGVAQGLNFHNACNYATTADLGTVTYNNGSSGVGATLTNAGTQAALVIDGHTFTATDVTNAVRVLVKNESNAAYNGIYTVTNQGSVSTNWQLTRATDYDSTGTGTNEIDAGDFVLVLSGTANANTSWVQQTPLPITIGTTGIVFTQFGAPVTYSAGTGLSLVGTTFSLSTPVAITNGGTGQTSASAAFNALSPITTTGDLIIGNGTNSATRLPIGTNGYVLTSNGTTASWQASTGGVTSFQTSLSGLSPSTSTTGAVTLSGTLGTTSGGTGLTSYTTGDIIYASATNTLSKLPVGTNGYVLTLAGGLPTWAASTGGVTSFSAGSTGLTPNTATTGAITLGGTLGTGYGGTGLTSFTANGAVYATSSSALTTGTLPTSGGGTGLTTYTTGDIIYSSATNTLSKLGIGTNGYYLSVSAGVPAWAALPANVSSISFGTTGLTPSTGTTGAVTVAGTLVAANGGTGQSTYTIGDVLYASGTTAISKLGIGSTGQVLTVSGGVPTWAAATGGATGGGTDQIFWNNGQTVNTSYSIPASTNAGTFGPVTIGASAVVTIPSSSSWTVV